MSDPDINELEALTALVHSDGWAVLQAHLEQEWGAAAYAQRIDAAITDAKQRHESAEGDICELGAAARAVRLFAQWPETRVKQLKAKDRPGRLAGLAGLRRA